MNKPDNGDVTRAGIICDCGFPQTSEEISAGDFEHMHEQHHELHPHVKTEIVIIPDENGGPTRSLMCHHIGGE